MYSLADKITNYIVDKGVIDKEDYNMYHYGFQTGIELLLCLGTGLVIACILNIFWEFIVVLSVLLPLRAYICGIHMKKFSTCFFCSVVLVTCGPFLAKEIMLPKLYMILFAVGILFLLHKIAFVTTAYQSDYNEVMFFARQRRKILVGIFLMLLLFAIFDMTGFIKQVFYALSVALFSVIAEVIVIKSVKLKN
ncbi:MAG: accessory gene regulator B family protein [Clostridium sp.]|nr:accessory gene regulator B family protein [Clostridium sp.]